MKNLNTISFFTEKNIKNLLDSKDLSYLVINIDSSSNILINTDEDEKEFSIFNIKFSQESLNAQKYKEEIKELKEKIKKLEKNSSKYNKLKELLKK